MKMLGQSNFNCSKSLFLLLIKTIQLVTFIT